MPTLTEPHPSSGPSLAVASEKDGTKSDDDDQQLSESKEQAKDESVDSSPIPTKASPSCSSPPSDPTTPPDDSCSSFSAKQIHKLEAQLGDYLLKNQKQIANELNKLVKINNACPTKQAQASESKAIEEAPSTEKAKTQIQVNKGKSTDPVKNMSVPSGNSPFKASTKSSNMPTSKPLLINHNGSSSSSKKESDPSESREINLNATASPSSLAVIPGLPATKHIIFSSIQLNSANSQAITRPINSSLSVSSKSSNNKQQNTTTNTNSDDNKRQSNKNTSSSSSAAAATKNSGHQPSRIQSTSHNRSIGTRNNNVSPSAISSPGVAATAGNTSTARLMDMGKKLLDATKEGQTEVVRQLVLNACAPFTSDWLGITALHMAASNGHSEIADILLKAGVNRDARTKLERTALHHAAQGGSLEVVDLLIMHGSDVNARDMLKMTPIHWAVERRHAKIVERLLFAGSDLLLKSKFQLTPIDIAQNSEYYEIVDLFKNWTKTGCSMDPTVIGGLNLTNCHKIMIEEKMDNHHKKDFASPLNYNINSATRLAYDGTKTKDNSNKDCGNDFNESHDKSFIDELNYHQQLAIQDLHHTALLNSGSGGGKNNIPYDMEHHHHHLSNMINHEPCIVDLVELEWNAECLKFEPDFFLNNNDDDEDEDEDDEEDEGDDGSTPKVEYLKKIVEELQKENRQLRQKVEQLSTSPTSVSTAAPTKH